MEECFVSGSRLVREIGAVGGHRSGDMRWEQVIHRPIRTDAFADLGGGNAQRPAAQGVKAEGFGAGTRRRTRTWDHDEIDERGQVVGVAPLGQGWDVVGTNQPVKGGTGETGRAGADGVDGIAGAAASQFKIVHLEFGMTGEGDAQPAETEMIRGRGVPGFERGPGGGNEDDAVESEFLAGGLGDEEMPEVNRIEGTAVETDAHGFRRCRLGFNNRVGCCRNVCG